MKLSFVGLGVMGYPMAGHLQEAGHDVTVYNRNAEKARDWVERYGGQSAPTPAAAVAGSEIAFLCVGNDDDVRAVVLGDDGIFSGLDQGALVIDHTTASAGLARSLAEDAATRGLGFLDAPVSGGQAGAENAALTIMVGGNQGDFDRAEAVLSHYARCVRLLGPAGSGQLAKMANQVCIAGVLQGLSEAMLLSEKAGLDTAAVIEVISKGAAQSWQMENRFATMLENHYDHGFAVDWMRKDLAIVQAEAARLDLELPITELVDSYYAEIQDIIS